MAARLATESCVFKWGSQLILGSPSRDTRQPMVAEREDELAWLRLFHELPPEQRDAIKTLVGDSQKKKMEP